MRLTTIREQRLLNGSLVRVLRARLGYSQTEMGRVYGISQRMVSYIEHGDADAPDTLLHTARYLLLLNRP